MEVESSLPIIITPGASTASDERSNRLRKPHSRSSIATNRFSCASFLTSGHPSQNWPVVSCLPRWRSLPSNLEDEVVYDDCPELLKAWSRYRLTNMARRYKTMDYIHMMMNSNGDLAENSELNCGLSMCVGLSVSRDILDESGSVSGSTTPFMRSPSDEQLSWSLSKCAGLTEVNLSEALVSKGCSVENLNHSQRELYRIEKWLQKCTYHEETEVREIDSDPCASNW